MAIYLMENMNELNLIGDCLSMEMASKLRMEAVEQATSAPIYKLQRVGPRSQTKEFH